jgi:hypothetical protein
MKKFHLSKIYFNKTICDDADSNVRVVVSETPSLDVLEEEYSLRVETRHEDKNIVNRNYAIEHHNQEKHFFPHIQFKFHTEEIGTFRIRVDFADSDEYMKGVLGFIFKIKKVLNDLEKYKVGITEEILVLDLVDKLSDEGKFLTNKIYEGIKKYSVEFDNNGESKKIDNVNKNPLLLDFLGKENVDIIVKNYNKK